MRAPPSGLTVYPSKDGAGFASTSTHTASSNNAVISRAQPPKASADLVDLVRSTMCTVSSAPDKGLRSARHRGPSLLLDRTSRSTRTMPLDEHHMAESKLLERLVPSVPNISMSLLQQPAEPKALSEGERPSETPTEQLARLKALVLALDPDVLAAIDDVDRSLVQASLALSPFQRLEVSFAMLEGLRRFRRVPADR